MGRFPGKAIKVFLLAVLAGLCLWGARHVMDRQYVFWNGVLISRTARQADISGRPAENLAPLAELTALRELDARDTAMTAEQHSWLQQNLPGCHIRWDVPLQGRFYSQDARAIAVPALTEAEIALLSQFPRLECLDLGEWTDSEKILAIRRLYPQCRLLYRVEIAGAQWGNDAVSLVLENARAEELREKLPLLPALESVFLTGAVPEREALAALTAEFPDIHFLWKLDVPGATVETDLQELDLTGISPEDLDQIRQFLTLMPRLERVVLNGENFAPEELAALIRQWPELVFSFDITIGGRAYSSQSEEIDLSNIPLGSVKEIEDLLPCFPRLKKVVMCQCGIADEEMDALNRRHADIRFVWSVDLAGMPFRTDAVHFTPNRWGLKLTNENIAALRYCTDMVCVDIGHAKKVTDCSWAASMPGLRYLVLAETGISDISALAELKELVFLELFLSRVKDLSPLTGCTALEDLNLCYTHPDPAPLGQMPWLKRVWWTGHWKAKRDLPKLLPHAQLEFSSPSSTGKGWREGAHYYAMRDFIGMKYMTG